MNLKRQNSSISNHGSENNILNTIFTKLFWNSQLFWLDESLILIVRPGFNIDLRHNFQYFQGVFCWFDRNIIWQYKIETGKVCIVFNYSDFFPIFWDTTHAYLQSASRISRFIKTKKLCLKSWMFFYHFNGICCIYACKVDIFA